MRCKTDDGDGVYLGDGISSRQFFRGEEGEGSFSLSRFFCPLVYHAWGEKGRGKTSEHRFGSSLIELKFFERSSTAFMPTSIPE